MLDSLTRADTEPIRISGTSSLLSTSVPLTIISDHARVSLVSLGLALEGISLKMLHEGIKWGGGQSDPSPLLSTPLIRLTRYLAHIMSVLCTFN